MTAILMSVLTTLLVGCYEAGKLAEGSSARSFSALSLPSPAALGGYSRDTAPTRAEPSLLTVNTVTV
jgi:hypothetical protein